MGRGWGEREKAGGKWGGGRKGVFTLGGQVLWDSVGLNVFSS